jgi:hypothetical protein
MNECCSSSRHTVYLTGAETTDDIGLPAVRVPPVSSSISYYALQSAGPPQRSTILGAFAKLRKAVISLPCLVCLHRTLRLLPLEDFYEILHLRIFRKSVDKI